jgi:hypothetical protein
MFSIAMRRAALAFAGVLAALLIAALPAPAFAADGATDDFAGVYVGSPRLVRARRQVDDALYQNDVASGVYLRLIWSQLEPKQGQFDFTVLNREIDRAVATKKRVSFSIIGGGYAPDWLSSAGIQTLRFSIARGGQKNRNCDVVDLPVPWDPAYQAAFLSVWKAVRDRISQIPGGMEAVRIVKLTGVNRITAELRLPGTFGQREDDACGKTDDAAIWNKVGYRPQKVVDAWVTIATGISQLFPSKHLGLDILEQNDFPPIGDDGGFSNPPPVKSRIIDEGIRRFGKRFSVQWNGLNKDGKLSDTVIAAGRKGAIIGWQSNQYQGHDGAGCNLSRRTARAPCDTDGYRAILKRGLDTGAAFIEVWAPDVRRFPDAVRDADVQLRGKFDRK